MVFGHLPHLRGCWLQLCPVLSFERSLFQSSFSAHSRSIVKNQYTAPVPAKLQLTSGTICCLITPLTLPGRSCALTPLCNHTQRGGGSACPAYKSKDLPKKKKKKQPGQHPHKAPKCSAYSLRALLRDAAAREGGPAQPSTAQYGPALLCTHAAGPSTAVRALHGTHGPKSSPRKPVT